MHLTSQHAIRQENIRVSHGIAGGTKETCQKIDCLKTWHPQDASCWRYSFRYHLEDAFDSGGFMIQVVEAKTAHGQQELGKDQMIESEMALDVGTKVFRVFRPRSKKYQLFELFFVPYHIEKVMCLC